MTGLSHQSSRLLALKPTTGPGFHQYVDPVFVSYSALVDKILLFVFGERSLKQGKDGVKDKNETLRRSSHHFKLDII
jgi:hypothetical protein